MKRKRHREHEYAMVIATLRETQHYLHKQWRERLEQAGCTCICTCKREKKEEGS